MNTFVMIMQYSAFIVIIYSMFTLGSIVMIPFAYIKCLTTKFQIVMKAGSILDKIKQLFLFLIYGIVGIPILIIGLLADAFYFWANNFRTNLKQITIERKQSTITSETIRRFTSFCAKYNEDQIRSIYCKETVITMRKNYNIKENIQYLLFGQFINGKNSSQMGDNGSNLLKNTKTQNL